MKNRLGQSFVGNAVLLTAGTAVGQAAMIVCAPAVTRLYSPGEFGVLGLYISVLAFITVIASFRYEVAIVLPRSDRTALNLLVLCVFSVCATTIATAILTPFLLEFATPRLSSANATVLASLIPLGVLVGGVTKLFFFWSLRSQSFGSLALSRATQGVGVGGGQLGFGAAGFGAFGLLAGHALGICLGALPLLRSFLGATKFQTTPMRFTALMWVARRYKRFPLYSAWSDLANTAVAQAPTIYYGAVYSTTAAGHFFLAHRIVLAPVGMISEALSKAFFRAAVQAKRDGNLCSIAERLVCVLLYSGLPLFAIALVLAPQIVEMVFGSTWLPAAEFIRVLIPWIAAVYICVPVLSLCSALEYQGMDALFQVTLAVATGAALLLGDRLRNPLLTGGLYSGAAALVYCVFAVKILKAAGVSVAMLGTLIVREILIAGIMTALLRVGQSAAMSLDTCWLQSALLCGCIMVVLIIATTRCLKLVGVHRARQTSETEHE